MPIVTYAVSAPQMTLEELSWFIDDKIGREVQSVRGVAQIGASAAWTARSACARPAAPAGAWRHGGRRERAIARHQRGFVRRTERDRRCRANHPHAGRRYHRRAAGLHEYRAAGRPQCAARRLGKFTDFHEEPRSFARLNGKPISRSAFCAQKVLATWPWPNASK